MTEGNEIPPPPPPSDPVPTVPAATPPMDYAGAGGIETNKDARTWGMLAHLSALAGVVIPLGNVIGPLVVWLIKKQESPFVDDQGKESLNFQITATIALLIATATLCIGIGIILLPIVGLVVLIFSIIGAVKANEGVRYRYPFALRLIS